MSADLLRRAAALMRERTEDAKPGPWRNTHDKHGIYSIAPTAGGIHGRVADLDDHDEDCGCTNAEYIASMHPPVALAVADWLEAAAADLWAHGPLCCTDGCMECDDDLWAPHVRRALAVARAYLGEDG